ncbi:hypothetical protein RGW67_28415 [Bacillus mycoides]|uniref:hypothetical protein n=1 Tax=Bacillus mycoides TaxID=1405 RepID=UPI00285356EC|nr:hypothetical protein [Bacillus mycoides]MDR4904765.1 hypothetical protein [Bacillus mycoides]
MELKEEKFVIIVHPDYPELCGIARIINPRDQIIRIEFCDDKTKWLAASEFLRHAIPEEKEQLAKANCSKIIKGFDCNQQPSYSMCEILDFIRVNQKELLQLLN